MKKTFAMRWAKDLENPRVKQDVGALKTRNGYCCLGRACVLAGLHAVRLKNQAGYWYDKYQTFLPHSVAHKYNIYSIEGERRDGKKLFIGGGKYVSLADANDSNATFKQIAAYIRKHYREL